MKNIAIIGSGSWGVALAIHLGRTSPKISTNNVIAIVLMAAPASPNNLIHSTVATDEQPIFTILFPISIDVSALSYC